MVNKLCSKCRRYHSGDCIETVSRSVEAFINGASGVVATRAVHAACEHRFPKKAISNALASLVQQRRIVRVAYGLYRKGRRGNR